MEDTIETSNFSKTLHASKFQAVGTSLKNSKKSI